MTTKKQQRKYLSEKRNQLTKQEIAEKSQRIFEQLVPYLQDKQTVLIYSSFSSEVDTGFIRDWLTLKGKQVCWPYFSDDDSWMEAYKADKFTTNKWGILKPEPDEKNLVEKENIDAIIIPCVGYDAKGHRLGHGGGYYDRYLEDYKGLKILVGFVCQKLEDIKVDEYDQTVDMIVNEEEVIIINN